MSTGANFFVNVTGTEIDVDADAGTSPLGKVGLNITTIGTDGAQGTGTDAAFLIGSVIGSPGWKNGIQLSNYNGAFPISNTGTVFSIGTAGTVGNGIDLSLLTCTSTCFRSPGFQVNGDGSLLTNAHYAFTTQALSFGQASHGAGLIVTDPGAAAVNFLQVQGAGTGGAVFTQASGETNVNWILSTKGNGSLEFAAGGVIQAYVTATAAATIALTMTGGTGQLASIGCTGSATCGVQIAGPAAGDVVLGSLGAMNTAAQGGFVHLPFSNGTPTGVPFLLFSPACQWNDSSFTLNCYSVGAGAWKHITFSAGAG